MKIIEALKQTKILARKAEDLRTKIGAHCVDMDIEKPVYGGPDGSVELHRKQVDSWLQSHQDILREIEGLRLAVSRTNLLTIVDIELQGKKVSKPITAWIARRKELAPLDMKAWQMLTDRNLKDQHFVETSGAKREIRVRRYYDPATRDNKVAALRDEPSLIDAALEIVNATTDIIEATT